MKSLYRFLGGAAFVAAFVASCMTGKPGGAQQQVNFQWAPFTLTAAGQASPIINCYGLGNATVQVDNIGGGATLTPQVTGEPNASATSPWAAASTVGNGSITGAGTQAGLISGSTTAGTSGFRLYAQAITSTPVTGKISCSNAQANTSVTLSGNVAVSPIPLPVSIASPLVISSLPPVTVANAAPTNAAGNLAVGVCDKTTAANCQTVSAGGVASVTTPAPLATGAHGGVVVEGVASGTTVPVSIGAALPAGSNLIGAVTAYQNSSGNVIATICDNVASLAVSSNATTQIVAASGSTAIYLCGATVAMTGTNTGASTTLVYGTGTNCASGQHTIGGQVQVGTGTAATPEITLLPLQVIAYYPTPASQAVCATSAGTASAYTLKVYYAQHA